MQKAVQLIYLGLMSEFFKSDMKKMGYRLNSKRAISHLAVVAEVSERVVLDVINRRGAYSKGGLSKREVEWVREFMNLSPRVYREFCDFLDGKFNVSDR